MKHFLIFILSFTASNGSTVFAANLNLGDYWRLSDGTLVKTMLGPALNHCCEQNGLSPLECMQYSAVVKQKFKTHVPSMDEIAQIYATYGGRYSKEKQPGLERFEYAVRENSNEIFYSDFPSGSSHIPYELDATIIWTSSLFLESLEYPPRQFLAAFNFSKNEAKKLLNSEGGYGYAHSAAVRCVTSE
jgi:hypothetical protein